MPYKKISTLALVALAFALSASLVGAQVLGDPLISTGGSGSASSPAYIDALVATATTPGGTDMCTRIQYVYNNLLSSVNSAVVDARGFTGTTWSCSVNPFTVTGMSSLVNKHGWLLLGNVDIPAQTTWNIPSRVVVAGIGTGGSSGTASAFNTIIHAAGTFPASSPVLQMGLTSGGPFFGVQIRNLTVDCLGINGCVGVLNNNAEEGSFLNNVTIFNAPAIGLHVTTNNSSSGGVGAVNSGPYTNVSIQFQANACGGCSASTLALQVDGIDGTGTEGRSIRGFDNFTVSGNSLSNLFAKPTLIYVYGVSTEITNSHVEYCSTACIQIGQTGTPSFSTYGVRLSDITVGVNNGGYDVVIGSVTGSPVGNVIVENLNHETPANTNTLKDYITGNAVPDTYLGWYYLGNGTTPAVFTSSSSMTGSGTPYELKIPGNVDVIGTLTKPGGSFRIDHPLDPANEYLYHSFVESPDMMNIYNGSVTTDKHGLATVILPDYFEALNRDFRYQLTPVGQFAQAYVAEKVAGNHFVIKTSKPGVEVSWQVTGIRHDAYANQHRIQVEEPKPQSLRNR